MDALSNYNSVALHSLIRTLAPFVPNELIPDKQYQRIGDISTQLPVLRVAGFETDLTRSHTGFVVRLAASDINSVVRRQLLFVARHDPSGVWDSILKVMDLPSVIEQWLKFDLPPGQNSDSMPSVFCRLTDAMINDDYVAAPSYIHEIIETLSKNKVEKSTTVLLDRIYQALPPSGEVFQIGLLLARQDKGLRLLIRGLTPEAIIGFLKTIEWPGDLGPVYGMVQCWSKVTDLIFLSIDVGSRVGPRLGLELKYHKHFVEFDPRWERLLSAFVASGLCAPKQKDALLHWSGITRESSSVCWPEHLKGASEWFGNEFEPVIVRAINHAKIVIDEGAIATAKVYYGFYLNWEQTADLDMQNNRKIRVSVE